MKKEKQLCKIGNKLGISETEIKATLLRNRNKIVAGLIIGVATVIMGRIWFEPLHYTAASLEDFDFWTRFL